MGLRCQMPNPPAAPNSAGALLLQTGHRRRRAGEPSRWAIPGHATRAGLAAWACSVGRGVGPSHMTTMTVDSRECRADTAFESRPETAGRSWPIQAAQVNAPFTPRFHAAPSRRRVPELQR
jgi:hypothetical protein